MEQDDMSLKLTFRQAQHIEHAINQAYAVELARLRMEAGIDGSFGVTHTNLLNNLINAREILRVTMPRADEMGG